MSLARSVGQLIRAKVPFACARMSDRIVASPFLAIARAGWGWRRWGWCLRTVVPPGHDLPDWNGGLRSKMRIERGFCSFRSPVRWEEDAVMQIR